MEAAKEAEGADGTPHPTAVAAVGSQGALAAASVAAAGRPHRSSIKVSKPPALDLSVTAEEGEERDSSDDEGYDHATPSSGANFNDFITDGSSAGPIGVGRRNKIGYAGNPMVEARMAKEKAEKEAAAKMQNKARHVLATLLATV